jgi:hypothetical protein
VIDRGPPRVLLSFAYYRDANLDKIATALTIDGVRPSIAADSGAFSAATMGWQVEPGEYAGWLLRWWPLFDFAFTLDVIGDPAASRASHDDLEERVGHPVVPVVHYGATTEHLADYHADGHRLIALGGLAMRDRASAGVRARWLHGMFTWAADHDVVFHGLGIGSYRQMWSWPWYSVDASSWSQGHRFGTPLLFDPARNDIVKLDRSRSTAHHQRAASILRSRGVDPALLAGGYSRFWAGAVSADSYRRAEAHIRARRGPVRWAGHDDGLRVYLADTGGLVNLGMIVGATDAPTRSGLEHLWTPTVLSS